MKKVYVSGDMEGVSKLDIRKRFDGAITEVLEKFGSVEVVDSSVLDVNGLLFGGRLLVHLMVLNGCDVLVLQSGWRGSKDCIAERAFAEAAGIEVVEL